MRNVIDELIRGLGKRVTISFSDGTLVSAKALVMPLFTKNDDPAGAVTRFGDSSKLRWRYVGPRTAALTDIEGAALTMGEAEYEFVWVKSYDVSGKVTHWEGLLKRREAEYGQA